MTTMSKLKRKKTAAESIRPKLQSIDKNTNESLRRSQESQCSKALAESSAGGVVPWWERSELNDVERIWAHTLRAFCPNLQTHQEECIPQLPPPSSTPGQEASVENVSDLKWGCPKKDIDLQDLPAPSYAIHPTPVTVETGLSGPIARPNQEDDISVCDLKPTQHQRLEGRALLEKQSDMLDPAGKVLQFEEIQEDQGNAAVKMCSSFKRPRSYEAGEGSKLNPKTPPVHIYGQKGSVPAGQQGQEWGSQVVAGGSGAGVKGKSGAGGSKVKVKTKHGAGGSGTQLKIKPGDVGSTSGLGLKSKPGSETELGTKSGESRLDLEKKTGEEESKREMDCCPMCLMPFPAGFSQMECDGHLAQCLSEMQEDILW